MEKKYNHEGSVQKHGTIVNSGQYVLWQIEFIVTPYQYARQFIGGIGFKFNL